MTELKIGPSGQDLPVKPPKLWQRILLAVALKLPRGPRL